MERPVEQSWGRLEISHTGVMDYDEACFMHLTPEVVHNFPKAVGVYDFCPLCTKRSQIPILKEKGETLGILVFRVSTIDGSTLPQDCVEEQLC